MSKDQTRTEHSYVILNQQPATDESLTIDEQSKVEQENEASPAESSFSISDERYRSSLLSRSEFSDLSLKLLSALFYGVCSFCITVVNKIVLTSYGFPSVTILGVGQMLAILGILKVASLLRIVIVRKHSIRNKKLWTLASLYLGNLVSGLGGTKHLPLPMFIALRRFSIAMTAIGEFYMLHVRQSLSIICTIIAMIVGSFIAAATDLTFNAKGYTLIMISNLFTAANGVYTKKTIDAREINKHEILYYNALFSILPLILLSICTNDLESLRNFEHCSDIGFALSFLASCFMGYLLMYSTVLCTHYNSALTTTIVGTLKNILTTYVGMYIGGDYRFNLMNFIGLNISLMGSLVYTYLSFTRPGTQKPEIGPGAR